MKRTLALSSLAALASAQFASAALVGHWTFDEGSGSTAFDSSGFGNNGTITGATYAPGQYGTALSFNGATHEVLIAASASLNFVGGTEFTAMAWYNPSAAPTGACCGQIVGQRTATTWMLRDDRRDGGAEVEMLISTDTGNFQGDSPADGVARPDLDTGTWHHIAASVDLSLAGGEVTIYLDGNVADTYNINGNTFAGTGGPTRIGLAPDGAIVGLIDDVKIFNTALTQAEVQAAMIPEPSTFALFGLAGIGLVLSRRR